MEQVFNFKLTRLGACAVGSLIGKTNGWPRSQAGEPEQVEGGRSKMGAGGRKLPMWAKGGSLLWRSVCSLQTPAAGISPDSPEGCLQPQMQPLPIPPPDKEPEETLRGKPPA